MILSTVLAVAAVLSASAAQAKLDPVIHDELLLQGPPQIGLWQALHREANLKAQQAELLGEGVQHPISAAKTKYQPHCFYQPISHFSSSPNTTFCQRYWIDASSYKPGGPVFVLDGGETEGDNRLPFLEKGILQILANATNGISIVLEHRYYGESIPVKTLSTDDLRFLNNAEAMQDSADFIEFFSPPASVITLDDPSALHPNNTAWIYYGGSYAGARAAHMRTQYPHLVWGAIASSAVTHAQVSYPQYNDPVQEYAPEDCISALRSAVKAVDTLLDLPEPVPQTIKSLFGLGELGDVQDFASVLHTPLGLWQAKNWDPKVGSEGFQHFCDALTAGKAGSKIGLVRIPAEVINFANYIKEKVVSKCPRSDGNPPSDIEDCFGSQEDSKFQVTTPDQTWRLWLFQVCTQWGYFQHAPTEGPSVVSKHVTLEYTSKICKQAYPPGKHFQVPEVPDVEEVNARGDYDIEYSRLAFIDGDRDPWRPVTPQSDLARKRTSSVDKPVHMIFDGVHHYDENGLNHHENEPSRIKDVHALEKSFVQEWVAQFEEHKKARV